MKTPLFLSVCAAAALFSQPLLAAQPTVWMLGTVSSQGTTQSKTLFFSDPAIRSLAECKEEIQRGRLNQWRYYNPPSGRSFNVGESINFRCVLSEGQPDKWIRNAPYSLTYLLTLDGDRLTLKGENTLATCLSARSGNSQCTSASQHISF